MGSKRFAVAFVVLSLLVTPVLSAAITMGTAAQIENIHSSGSSQPSFITAVGCRVFFAATDGGGSGDGNELWVSDGTAAGTFIVEDINEGGPNSDPQDLFAFGDLLLFTANDGDTGREPYVSDGTAAGTMILADIHAAGGSNPSDFTIVGNRVFFVANSGTTGRELWVTDGTPGGTMLVENINGDASNSGIANLVALGDSLLIFSANDGTNGQEAWVSDGTAAGTFMLKNINNGDGGQPESFTAGEKVFFVQDSGDDSGEFGKEVWVTDGTTAGTVVVDVRSGTGSSNPLNLAAFNGGVLFSADDASGIDRELWFTDGTTFSLVKDINSGAGSSSPDDFAILGDVAVFTATNGGGAGENGLEVWVTDGTTDGTVLLMDINAGTSGSSPSLLAVAGNQAYYLANGGLGQEIYATDGSTMVLTRNFNGGGGAGVGNTGVSIPAPIGNMLAFIANDGDGDGDQVWITNGTGGDTVRVTTVTGVNAWTNIESLEGACGRLFFQANDADGNEPFSVSVCPTIEVTAPENLTGQLNEPYSEMFTSDATETPVSFSITAGTLPAGMTLEPDGELTGTPTEGGTFQFTVTATDANGCTGSLAVELVIECPEITVTPDPAISPGTAGSAFPTTEFSQTGGSGTITWSITGTLPSGMSFNTGTAELSGTPMETGNFPITITATDENNCAGGHSFTLVINCQVITVTPTSLTAATTGSAYGPVQFQQSGGIGGITWSQTGTLPTGITFNTSNGQLSGTPTEDGTFPITVTATDGNGCQGFVNVSLVVNCPTITVNPTTIPAGSVGDAYTATQFTQTGGSGAVTFALTGTLPNGMSFNSGTATLDGTPTEDGSFPITITATDANGCQGSRQYTLAIDCSEITVTPTSLSAGTAGSAYTPVTFQQSGGVGTVDWSISGSLPTGMSFNTGTAQLSGTPTQTGTFPITITATDDNGCTGSSAVSLVINCQAITVTPTNVPSGTAGVAYTTTNFQQSGGIGSVTFSFTGTLPTGMSLNSSGVLSGTPTQTGTFPITVTATDSNGCTGSRSVSVVINCPTINVSPTSVPGGTQFVAYPNTTFSQTGGVGAITWSISGTLPTGMTFNTGTATLGGTPTQSGSFPVTITATDANGCSGGSTVTISIAPSAAPIPTMSAWMLLALALMCAVVGAASLKVTS